LELVRAFDSIPAHAFVILDCLTLWVANALEAGWSDEEVERAGAAVATIAAAREQPTVVVSNEVGLGLVPQTPLGRSYRDLLGRVNALFAAEAEDAYLMVAGRLLQLT
jgi:adenosyl cobinamide kinase/adenosyl cobinamide phosphate guanylyltransferase